jgi:hypothetical protein
MSTEQDPQTLFLHIQKKVHFIARTPRKTQKKKAPQSINYEALKMEPAVRVELTTNGSQFQNNEFWNTVPSQQFTMQHKTSMQL